MNMYAARAGSVRDTFLYLSVLLTLGPVGNPLYAGLCCGRSLAKFSLLNTRVGSSRFLKLVQHNAGFTRYHWLCL